MPTFSLSLFLPFPLPPFFPPHHHHPSPKFRVDHREPFETLTQPSRPGKAHAVVIMRKVILTRFDGNAERRLHFRGRVTFSNLVQPTWKLNCGRLLLLLERERERGENSANVVHCRRCNVTRVKTTRDSQAEKAKRLFPPRVVTRDLKLISLAAFVHVAFTSLIALEILSLSFLLPGYPVGKFVNAEYPQVSFGG